MENVEIILDFLTGLNKRVLAVDPETVPPGVPGTLESKATLYDILEADAAQGIGTVQANFGC